MWLKNSNYITTKILSRVYVDNIKHNKTISYHCGVIGDETGLKDVNGTPLFVGDVVTGKNNFKHFIISDWLKPGVYFPMGLASDNPQENIKEWNVKLHTSHIDLGVGFFIDDMYVIKGRKVKHHTKEDVLEFLKNENNSLDKNRAAIIELLENVL